MYKFRSFSFCPTRPSFYLQSLTDFDSNIAGASAKESDNFSLFFARRTLKIAGLGADRCPWRKDVAMRKELWDIASVFLKRAQFSRIADQRGSSEVFNSDFSDTIRSSFFEDSVWFLGSETSVSGEEEFSTWWFGIDSSFTSCVGGSPWLHESFFFSGVDSFASLFFSPCSFSSAFLLSSSCFWCRTLYSRARIICSASLIVP